LVSLVDLQPDDYRELGTILEVNKGEEFKDSSAWEQMFCV
jgi:hypothetical protein